MNIRKIEGRQFEQGEYKENMEIMTRGIQTQLGEYSENKGKITKKGKIIRTREGQIERG